MKANQSSLQLLSKRLFICISLFLALGAEAQWIPAGPPSAVSQEFTTTGGITYFRLVAPVSTYPAFGCCKRVAAYNVSRNDTDLYQTIQCETWSGHCLLSLCNPWLEEVVSVLGALSPGNYRLILSATDFSFPLPQVWSVCPFSVPTNSYQMLAFSTAMSTNTPLLFISVVGVSNALYVLESSANLTNWTAIKTNLGAPVTFSVGLTNGPQRFYRATALPTSRRL